MWVHGRRRFFANIFGRVCVAARVSYVLLCVSAWPRALFGGGTLFGCFLFVCKGAGVFVVARTIFLFWCVRGSRGRFASARESFRSI